MTINGTNTFFDGNYNYTNLSLENKPIRDLISISYKKLNDENIYFFKNANDFQHENIKTNFIKFVHQLFLLYLLAANFLNVFTWNIILLQR